MNIPRNHVESLMEFGYTEPEAQFLYIVATHSGYFTLRQYLNFTGARRGKRSSLLARKLLNNGHASVRDYMGYGSIYHLFSRTLYGRIEKGNLRNRRAHSFEFIRTRLVLLDFILANRDADYLETEQDKVNFFCEKLGVSKEFLPAKVYEGGPGSRPTIRYFVDKFPLFLAPPLPGTPPVVTFVLCGFRAWKHHWFFDAPRSLSIPLPSAPLFSLPLYISQGRPVCEDNRGIPLRGEKAA